MKRLMITFSIIFLSAFIFFTVMYCFDPFGIYLSLSITFGTFSYHLIMRLVVGLIFNIKMHNNADYHKRMYRLKPFEIKLYKLLMVKKWKDHMPTFDVDVFDPALKSWEEIAQAMCQSELVHRVIIALSFLPIILAIWFGDFPVFLITSVLAAGIDLMYVMMQRYNRERILVFIIIMLKKPSQT